MLWHLLIPHTSTKENGRFNEENGSKGFGTIKQVERWNLQNLQWFGLESLWKWMGNTRFSYFFRQTRFLMYPFLQKGVLVSEPWSKKYLLRMNFLSQKGKKKSFMDIQRNLDWEQVNIQRSHYSTLSLQLHTNNWTNTLADAALF